MTGAPYDKLQFEEDLNALGSVPRGDADMLPELMQGQTHAVVTDGVGRVSLLGVRRDYDFPEAIEYGFDKFPVSYDYTDGVLTSKIGGAPVTAYNPFALNVYFPDGNDGRGEAAQYVLGEPILQQVEEQSRTITEQEAVDRLRQDAHVLDAELGLFVPRVELERLYASSMLKDHRDLAVRNERGFQDFVRTQLPRIQMSIDPYNMNGELQLEEPVGQNGLTLNRASFVGTTQATFHGRVYRYDEENGKIEQLSLAPNTEAIFTAENRLYFSGGWANRRAWHVNDFLSMFPRTTDKQGQPMPLRLGRNMELSEAMRHSVLPEGIVGRPISATDMLHSALTLDRDSKYLTQLCTELRPPAVTDNCVNTVRDTAIEQWQAVFRGERTVEPRVVGLRAVAIRAQIFRGSSPSPQA